jgi:hypothetical protein
LEELRNPASSVYSEAGDVSHNLLRSYTGSCHIDIFVTVQSKAAICFVDNLENGERSNHVEEISLSKNGLDDNTTVGHCNQQQPMRRCAWIFRRVNDIKKDKDDDGIVYLTGYQTFGGDC